MSVPSKTFLVGEYAVLKGAPALIAATGPSFEFRALNDVPTQQSLFHASSPAGVWFHESEIVLKSWKVDLDDPHKGAGGFGASGAQFVFYHALATYTQSGRTQDDVQDVWQDFKACDKSGGSGADVVAQTLGGITCFSSTPFEAKSYDWPFDETDFVIIRTGNKVTTHMHLAQQQLPNLDDLTAASNVAVEGFFKSNIEEFASGVAVFQKEMLKAGLQSEGALPILEKLNSAPGVLVTKGCGAMGADTVLAVIDNEYRTEFFQAIREWNFHAVATSLDLVPETKLKVN
jgi:mevalonate kinase